MSVRLPVLALIGLGLGWLFPPASPASPPPGEAAAKFFEDRVRPVLVGACFTCHGPEKPKGGLRLDSREAAITGGDLGPAVVPGDPGRSLLVKAVAYDGDLRMPPKGKLTDRQIADLAAWVRMGAPWPETPGEVSPRSDPLAQKPAPAADHWAFRPVRDPAPPAVNDARWCQTPIDRFVLAKLEAAGVKPAPPADRRTLIRRATFDLTGLPPTPEEVRAFVADPSPGAFGAVIDRLLASPHYGERWGRHWLDVARYADSNGMDENLAHANAWRYRDWVVRAFNGDMPFDRFVREQVAGDLAPAGGPAGAADGLIATGFLTVGPKMLAEDDPVKMQMDIVDEQLDTLGQAFLGLTLGCARCHDHKFDPVTSKDYYALAGIFKSTTTMDSFKVVAQWHERPLLGPDERDRIARHDARIAEAKAGITGAEGTAAKLALAEARRRAADYVDAAREVRRNRTTRPADPPRMTSPTPPAGAVVVEAEEFVRGNVGRDRDTYGTGVGVLVNAGVLPNFAEYDLAIPADGAYRLELRYAAMEARPVTVAIDGRPAGEAAGRATGGWFPGHQAWDAGPVLILKKGPANLRFERAGPFPHLDKFALVPLPPGQPVPVTPEQLAADRGLVPLFVARWVAHLDRADPAPEGDALRAAADAADGPFAVPAPPDPVLPPAAAAELRGRRDELAALEKSRPVPPTAMAVADGTPQDVRVHVRGSHLTLGPEVARGFPKFLAATNPPPIGPAESGRRQLAEWLTRPDHPLTARVAVNRLWVWHFGDGLVRTPDNFGRLGDAPAHGDLLDWLATRFVRSGWSVKAMHRLILSSAAYQTSAAFDAGAALKDPDGRLHSRWARRRLDAEELRDALLALSGALDRTAGGSLLGVANRQYVTNTENKGYDGYNSDRRSVYLPVVRSAVYEPFQAFDFPDPSVPAGRRAVTTVPPQALLLMNSDLVRRQTRRLAERLLAPPGSDDAGRVRSAYEAIFARPATAEEVDRACAFVREYAAADGRTPAADARVRAWQGLCRALVSSNEFIYVE